MQSTFMPCISMFVTSLFSSLLLPLPRPAPLPAWLLAGLPYRRVGWDEAAGVTSSASQPLGEPLPTQSSPSLRVGPLFIVTFDSE